MDKITESCDCGGTVRFSPYDLARQRSVRCSRGCEVKLDDQGGGARKAAAGLRKLDDNIKKLNRTTKFKL